MGSKHETDIWQRFTFSCEKNKSKCLVTGDTKNICRFAVAGQNPTVLFGKCLETAIVRYIWVGCSSWYLPNQWYQSTEVANMGNTV